MQLEQQSLACTEESAEAVACRRHEEMLSACAAANAKALLSPAK